MMSAAFRRALLAAADEVGCFRSSTEQHRFEATLIQVDWGTGSSKAVKNLRRGKGSESIIGRKSDSHIGFEWSGPKDEGCPSSEQCRQGHHLGPPQYQTEPMPTSSYSRTKKLSINHNYPLVFLLQRFCQPETRHIPVRRVDPGLARPRKNAGLILDASCLFKPCHTPEMAA